MKTPLWYDSTREKAPSLDDVGFVPKFSLAERERRWKQLRKKMFAHNIDALVLYGCDQGWGRGMVNFRYITHIADAHGGWAVFTADGECIVFVAPKHMLLPYSKYMAVQDWVTDLRPNTGLKSVVDVLKDKKLDKGRIGLVSYGSTGVSGDTMSHTGYTELCSLLPNAVIQDANPLLTEMRIIKSKEELDFLYKAGELARKKIDAMINSTHLGKTEAEMFAEMVASDIRNGGEPMTFLLLNSGNVYDELPEYKYLLHGCSQPASPTMRNLKLGDLAICEFHSVYGGYMAGAEYSTFLGTPPPELVEIHDASMESIQAACETAKPGVEFHTLWEAIRKPILDRGFDFCELGFHGHGLASPEYPLSVYREEDKGVMAGSRISDLEIEEDMVICLNIDVHNPAWRKDVGMMYGDMLHIAKDGAIKMINVPTEFICNKE